MAEDEKLAKLFNAAIKGQERLELESQGVEFEGEDAPVAGEGAEDIVVEDLRATDDQASEAVADGASEPAAAASTEPKKSAQDALTEALIKAKKEAVDALEQTQKEAKSMQDRLLRVSADFENFRKRARKQQESAAKFANEGLLKELLPVLDNFDRALEHTSADDDNPLTQGFRMVQLHLASTLEKLGLQGFSAQGMAFDPNVHEAVDQQPSDDHPPGSVLREYQKGYMLHERLLRPAMVVVALPGSAKTPAPVDGIDDAEAPSAESRATSEGESTAAELAADAPQPAAEAPAPAEDEAEQS